MEEITTYSPTPWAFLDAEIHVGTINGEDIFASLPSIVDGDKQEIARFSFSKLVDIENCNRAVKAVNAVEGIDNDYLFDGMVSLLQSCLWNVQSAMSKALAVGDIHEIERIVDEVLPDLYAMNQETIKDWAERI